MTHRVVMFSGGISSWAAARRVVDAHGPDGVVLLFADTLIEDPDCYRFLVDAAADLGLPVTRVADGRTPWEVFRDERFLGNSKVDPCSKILKRELMDRWVSDRFDPADTELVFGISWDEEHRLLRLQERRAPYRCVAPLCDAPYLSKPQLLDLATRRGLRPPRLYSMGFAHNNCGGFCVKAGQGHFATLLRTLPLRYAECEREEESLRALLGDVAVLRDRRGGKTRPMTLREFRERTEAGVTPDIFEIGGCGCAVDDEEPAE